MTLLALARGRLGLELAPSSGGAVARFTVDGSDVCRPMAAADAAARATLQSVERQHALGTRLTDLPLLPDHSGTALEARR